jgi:hypothetical protein
MSMSNLLLLVLFVVLVGAALAQKAQLVVQPPSATSAAATPAATSAGPKTAAGNAAVVSNVRVVTNPTTRTLTHKNGQSITVDRHDHCQLTVTYQSATRDPAGLEYVYTYSVHNIGSVPVHQLWFYTPLALIWFDQKGIQPKETRVITLRSEYPPQQTTIYARVFDVARKTQQLTTNPIPADTIHPELLVAVMKATTGEFDSVKIAVLGPHAPPSMPTGVPASLTGVSGTQ